MNKKSIIWAIIALAVIVGLAFLHYWHRPTDGVEPIKIGVVMSQTGFLASPGQSVINGINLCVEEFNAQNSENSIELIIEDSKSDPKVGVSAINKLINADRVKTVIGDLGSPIFLAMAPIAEKNKVVMISPGASNPQVREAGDYIFRIYTSDEFDGKVMATYLLDKKKTKSVALLHFNNDYGVGLSKAFCNEYIARNGVIAFNCTFDENSLDFKEIIIKLKSANVKDVYFIGSPKQDASFLRQAREANFKPNIYGVLSFEDSEFLHNSKNTFESVEYTTPYFDIESDNVKMKEFRTKYIEKYSTQPDLNSALGYDVASILIEALKNNDFKSENLKEEIYKIKNFPGLTGNTTFDDHGDVIKDVMIKEVRGDGCQKVLDIIKVN